MACRIRVAFFCCMSFLFLFLPFRAFSINYKPTEAYLINCGGSGNITVDDRVWQGDSDSQFVSPGRNILAYTETTVLKNVSVQNLLLTARIFQGPSKYSFSVTPHVWVWIRFYFFPFQFQAFDLVSSIFSVITDEYVLLSNLNVSKEMRSSNTQYFFREFSINITSETLSIRFLPAKDSSAFINALEVVSMPSDIILEDSSLLEDKKPAAIGRKKGALQSMYRVNVGGPILSPANDSLGRTWQSNNSFVKSTALVQNVFISSDKINYGSAVPTYFAPPSVYSTALQMAPIDLSQPCFNISWIFPIDAGFLYMVRLHFCEIVYTSATQRIFNVYLQKQMAFQGLDIVQQAGYDTAYFRDFTVNALDVNDTTLQIDIGPTPGAGAANNQAILNGIEIWKLNNSVGSLDGLASVPLDSGSKTKTSVVVGTIFATIIALVVLIGLLFFFYHQRSEDAKFSAWMPLSHQAAHSATMVSSKMFITSENSGTGSYISSAPSSLGRSFSFVDIQEATNNFNESLVLGVGGFGKVYKGELGDGIKVAIKRGNPRSEQGFTEFRTEIELLSKLRHRHLVSLIGYCEEHSEMILVYEYMANGPLRSHLYGSDLPHLTWRQRLEICIGAARGLHYLHTGSAQGIIHRDVKTTNILLDENFVAKVSDFGLSKAGPALDRTHVSTAVKGSFGYLDPEYFRRQQLTEKSDVYSFGVVLMEVLCARPVINPVLPRDQVNIADWAMLWQKKGMLDQIIDPYLRGTINLQSLKKFGETAEKCLAEQGIDRPPMSDVLWNLEYALQLQETGMLSTLDEERNRMLEIPIQTQEQGIAACIQNQSLRTITTGMLP